MKKWNFLVALGLAAITIPYSSCTKDDGDGGGGGSDSAVFTKKIVVEDLTGTWCQYCTRVADKLEKFHDANPNTFIVVGVHSGSTDPYKFLNYTSYLSKFGISGYPSVVLNRELEWDESGAGNSAFTAELAEAAPLGLKITSSINADNISGTVKVKFGTDMTAQPLKLVVQLVENGLIYPQANAYSTLYGGQDPVMNFVHNGVLRRTATDLWGDVIPADAHTKNNEYSFNFSFPFTGQIYGGGPYTVNPVNCGIVAMVVDGTNNETGAINAQYANAGATKNYD